jgi:hypothetical protein
VGNITNFMDDFFSVSDDDRVKELGHGFGVKGGRPSRGRGKPLISSERKGMPERSSIFRTFVKESSY